MKIKYNYFSLVLLCLAITIYACRKDVNKIESKNKTQTFGIDEAKKYLDSLGGSGSETIQIQSVDSAKSKNSGYVYWKYARELKAQTFDVVEIPLIFNQKTSEVYAVPGDSVSLKPDVSVANSSFSRGLIYQDQQSKVISKLIVTYIPDKSYLLKHNNDASGNWLNQMKGFFGYLEYKNWNGNLLYILRIEDGVVKRRYHVGRKDLNTPGSPQINSTLKTTSEQCYTVEIDTWEQNCSSTADGFTFNCGDWTLIHEEYVMVCEDPNNHNNPDPDPNDPPGGGGVDCTSIGKTVVDANGRIITNCTVPTLPLDSLPKDSCAQRAVLASLAATFSTQNNFIRSNMLGVYNTNSAVEYGANMKLQSLTSNNFYPEGVSPGDVQEWSPSFTWNATNGYSVGSTHGHMTSAPSPQDISNMLNNISKIISAGGGISGVNFYKSHATLTDVVATTNTKYMVTIKDWDKLQDIIESVPPDLLTSRYTDVYNRTNRDSETALLSIFSEAINLYKDEDNTNNFVPLQFKMDADNTMHTIKKPCN